MIVVEHLDPNSEKSADLWHRSICLVWSNPATFAEKLRTKRRTIGARQPAGVRSAPADGSCSFATVSRVPALASDVDSLHVAFGRRTAQE
jgi:hypothetical protein